MHLPNNKAAILSIMKFMTPKNVVGMMQASKAMKNVGNVALKSAKNERTRKIANLKKHVRSFVKNIQANHAYRTSKAARLRKTALVTRAHNLGLYKKLIPYPRGGFLGTASNAPNYLKNNRVFVKNLAIITPGAYHMKYPRR
jgi:hypothetical protein